MGRPAKVGAPGAAGDRHVAEKWPVRHGLAYVGGGLSDRPGRRAQALHGPDHKPGPEELGRRAALGDEVAGQATRPPR